MRFSEVPELLEKNRVNPIRSRSLKWQEVHDSLGNFKRGRGLSEREVILGTQQRVRDMR